VETGSDGLAEDRWTLGPLPGDPQRLEVRGVNPDNGEPLETATFTATATAGATSRVHPLAPLEQNAFPSGTVTSVPGVLILDAAEQPVLGVRVTFAEGSGSGSITRHSATTTEAGRAEAGTWTAPAEGVATVIATPDVPGAEPITFTARVLRFERTTGGCALASDDHAYCWGSNSAGRIGDGTVDVPAPRPRQVAATVTFASLAEGGLVACGLTAAGATWCWGYNGLGQLGIGSTEDQPLPTMVAGGLIFDTVNTSGLSTCALTADGTAYCWGYNHFGQLGTDDQTDRSTPTAVAGDLEFASLSQGGPFTCGVKVGGGTYCWGSEIGDQSGNPGDLTPQPIAGDPGFVRVFALADHACGLTTDGTAYCWGNNQFGGVGDGTQDNDRATPVPVIGGQHFTFLTGSSGFTCGLTTDSRVFCWGYNSWGMTGTGSTDVSVPVPTEVVGDLQFNSVGAAQGQTVCATTPEGRGYCWGFNRDGQLGDNTTASHRRVPTLMRP
jgi:alpha-tubulin suppressor-like RCC1 family protein